MASKQKGKNKQKRKINLKWVVVIIIALVAIVAGTELFLNLPHHSGSLPASISVNEADKLFKQGAYLIDVRQPEEWVAGHIQGAVLIPLGDLQSRISEIPIDRDLLLICRTGNRSAQAVSILRNAGLERSTSIAGGVTAWVAAGLPLVTGK